MYWSERYHNTASEKCRLQIKVYVELPHFLIDIYES